MLSKQYALQQIELALGRRTDRRLDAHDVLNQAGHYFYGMRDWIHARRPPALLDVVAEQPWVKLPDDFARLLGLSTSDDLMRGVQIVSVGELAELRNNFAVAGFAYWAAPVNYIVDPAGGDDYTSLPRLELYPTPTESATGFFRLAYVAGWVEVVEETEFISAVPDSCRGLYLELVRAFARGIERGEEDYLSGRLMQIAEGPMFKSAARTDSGLQRIVGRLRNGAAETGYIPSRVYDPVPPPSGP